MDTETKVILAIAVTFILTVGGCVARTHELIGASPDPIATACALVGSDNACLLVAERQ